MSRAGRFKVELLRVWVIRALLVVSFFLLSMPGKAEDLPDCGSPVEVRLSPAKSFQGSLVLVEARSALPLVELRADWFGQPLHFWRDAHSENVHRALLGVDLEQNFGVFALTLAAQFENGQRLECSTPVSIQARHFAGERLRVDRRFVELSPKDLERTEREGERLRELFARVTPERMWRGRFRLPVDGVKAAGNFGRRRFLNGQPRSPHSGEDFPAAVGVPVHAAQRGRVVLAEELFFSGNTVVLDHGLGLYTLYGHLESIAVGVGDIVATGAPLGRVGATGRVTHAHLHWAAHLNEARVSPLQLLSLLRD